MARVRYLQLDVFTEHPGGGNPLGVVADAAAFTCADMQAFARWTDLVETTFLLPASKPGASYQVRIFTPSKEIPFAGHPTIGSAFAALRLGLCQTQDGLLVQECLAGLLPIRVEADELYVRSPQAVVLQQGLAAHPLLTAALAGVQIAPTEPAFVEGGRRWWVAELADERALRTWHPPHDAIGALARATDSLGLCVFARAQGQPYQLVVRAFPAGVGIVEDPASGAANGLIAAYLRQRPEHSPLHQGYRVSQGREMGHDASILVRFDAQGEVWVGGRSHVVIDGHAEWPLAASSG